MQLLFTSNSFNWLAHLSSKPLFVVGMTFLKIKKSDKKLNKAFFLQELIKVLTSNVSPSDIH